jgi:alginate O-acetyltransferase complex protein AlgI
MLFNSFSFFAFLIVVLAVYFQLPHKWANRFLLAASCFFYACWDWRFLFPLLASTSIDYWCAKRMEVLILADRPQAERKPYLILSLVTNLALLGFFKYFNFFASSLSDLLRLMGIEANTQVLNIILPVGISFYTFQALSYTIDVYRGQIHATPHFSDFLLAVLYFPHLVAGPIQRASSLLPQVIHPRTVTAAHVSQGIHLIAWGFFKKVFIADNLAPYVNQVFTSPNPDGWQTLTASYAFAFQIYGDFSGYTDIARGVAKLMGFEFVLNFNLPYFATSPTEFWTRWHISLSSWLRDYLYIPLGGNRGSKLATHRNLMLTMIIGGFWHGAAWNFLLWGFYHGSLLVLHRLLGPLSDRLSVPKALAPLSFALRCLIMFHFTCYGWMLFRASSLAQIQQMTGSLFAPFTFDPAPLNLLACYALPLVAVQLFQFLSGKLDFLEWNWFPWPARTVVYSVMVYLVLFRGGVQQSFIYFQF